MYKPSVSGPFVEIKIEGNDGENMSQRSRTDTEKKEALFMPWCVQGRETWVPIG